MKSIVTLTVNDTAYEVAVAPWQTLLEVLREKLRLIGTKRRCDLGACGACTVLINGDAYLSCVMLAVDAIGKEILTIEGFAEGGDLHPLPWKISHCGMNEIYLILLLKGLLFLILR